MRKIEESNQILDKDWVSTDFVVKRVPMRYMENKFVWIGSPLINPHNSTEFISS